jgi:hypothetical protein
VAVKEAGQDALTGQVQHGSPGRNCHVAANGLDFACLDEENLVPSGLPAFWVNQNAGVDGDYLRPSAPHEQEKTQQKQARC